MALFAIFTLTLKYYNFLKLEPHFRTLIRYYDVEFCFLFYASKVLTIHIMINLQKSSEKKLSRRCKRFVDV